VAPVHCAFAISALAQDCPAAGRVTCPVAVLGGRGSGDYVYLVVTGSSLPMCRILRRRGLSAGVGLPAEVYGYAVSGGYAYVTYGEWDSREMAYG